mmetsp:Transcript_8607/g.23030  ORF Transcript_8607/g.23030 Transcript_8607/m.23030 type:complete len:203 (-) Transcript_8607:132-740(-)
MLDRRLADVAPISDDGVGDFAFQQLRRRQVAAHRVDGRAAVVEAEHGVWVREREVGVVECRDGTDVLPVSVEQVSLHVQPEVLRTRDDLRAEVVGVGEVDLQQVEHGGRLEDVDTHGGDERVFLRAVCREAEHGRVHLHRLQLLARRLLGKVDDASRVVNLHESERGGTLFVHGKRGDGDVRVGDAVVAHESLVVHAVQVVA